MLVCFSDGDVPVGFPLILDPPMAKVVEKGTTATLTCNAAGNHPLKIVWLKDLLPIQPSERFQFIGDIGGKSPMYLKVGETFKGFWK